MGSRGGREQRLRTPVRRVVLDRRCLPRNWSSTARGSTTSRTSPSGCPRNALDLHHRALRLGQVEPRVRHDLRRGAAPLRRVAVRVRPAVPADDGEARRRLDRRALAGDLDRPEDDVAQPSLDGRHRDRDLRLPSAAVRARGAAALPGLRSADRGSVARPDRRAGARAARGDAVHGQRARSCATARASSATCSRSFAATASRASRSTASSGCSRSRSRSTRSSSTRSRSSSTGS